jgi:hypothetical protein
MREARYVSLIPRTTLHSDSDRDSPVRFSLRFLTFMDRPRPKKGPLLVLKFFRGPHDFRSKKIFFTWLRRNCFRKIFYKFISGFPRFSDVLIGPKPCWKPAAVVIKLFWKPISKGGRLTS